MFAFDTEFGDWLRRPGAVEDGRFAFLVDQPPLFAPFEATGGGIIGPLPPCAL